MIINVMLSIETYGSIGASQIYGVLELERILKAGANAYKYKLYFDHKVENNNDHVIAFLLS